MTKLKDEVKCEIQRRKQVWDLRIGGQSGFGSRRGEAHLLSCTLAAKKGGGSGLTQGHRQVAQ